MNVTQKISIFFLLSKLKTVLPRHFKIRLALLIFLMVFSAFAEIISIGLIIPFLSAITAPSAILENTFIQPFLSFFSISSNNSLILFLTVTFCVAAVISAGLRLLTLWLQTRFCYSIGANLSSQIYKNSLYQSYSAHISRNSSEFISTIVSKTSASTSFAILPTLNILSSSIVLFAITATLIFIQPIVALSAFLLFGSLYGGVVLLTKKKLNNDSERISYEQDQVIKILQEGFGSIRDILVSNAQAQGQASLLSSPQNQSSNLLELTNGNIPVNLFVVPKLSLRELGFLLATWEHRVFVTASLMQINPFDQFGVAAGKTAAQNFLQK